jgi:hypothetical protein
MDFESLEQVLGIAIGDKVALGYLFHALKPVTPESVCERIRSNSSLFDGVQNTDWPKWRELINKYKLGKYITIERLTTEFQNRRPDLYNAAQTEPNGPAWFDSQVTTLRVRLGLDAPVTGWKKVTNQPSS